MEKLGVDLDDVVFDTNRSLTYFHNAKYGTSLDAEEVRPFNWHLESVWGCPTAEVHRRIDEWHESSFHDTCGIVVGAEEIIPELAKQHELHIITARSKQTSERTWARINMHFRGYFADVHFTNHRDEGRKTKSEICKMLGVKLMVEDAPHNVREIADIGATVLMMDTPWNQDQACSSSIIRVFNWQDVLRFVRS